MRSFSTNPGMAIFGRPLWLAYNVTNDLDGIAKTKLLGGVVGEKYKYAPTTRDHVFAVLSVRLWIDLNLVNPTTLPLAQNTVDLHMRRLESLDMSTGVMFTRTPVETILGKAAMQILLGQRQTGIRLSTHSPRSCWSAVPLRKAQRVNCFQG